MDHDYDSEPSIIASDISWPVGRPGSLDNATLKHEAHHPNTLGNGRPVATPKEILPGQRRALDGIAIRAFLLGIALGVFGLSATLLAYAGYQIWRLPAFLATLSLFHFLEFYTTARYNTPIADIDAFLLSRNGRAYNLAHASATFECMLTAIFLPSWQTRVSNSTVLCVGILAVIVGQVTRSMAMAHAGTNFNHTVQTRKAEKHQLVTTGIYGYLRHPAYFGFFWWGLGTQMVLGNTFCFVAYAYLLWNFFNTRIRREEQLLVDFFGDDYVNYRRRTMTGIPFI